ncbi:Poly (A) RNA polymerase cid14 [Heracleum sosnowskyi]|uniref:Poly (A) RNA polymerase cid14 n=1 Tax=Heracleum sosnowskyi TaxID=360622 RepID=A0AAD8HZ35_9APIA|nr:Poly (A) RNA polymerase cid14 [Heracleum sosnowskyi]
MGENEEWVKPSGMVPNGLLPNAGPLINVLDSDKWLKAEERTAELISCIQPNQPSEERRNAVADYVQRLIMKCFPCQVFTFGSVPLKTYLPDGDIDLTAFSNNQNLKETWATQVRDMLESEEKDDNAEFCVKEVQYIQAEVKIIKCLVENIVVDISFNQVGGLCTLCFLEEVDHLINQNHLFKRSIILIKAWCYYESRILGAHHGLISTYALETLVLYIFHVFNNSFTGPLEVLYRFLEFFSNFDWDNFCVSLWGPVSIGLLPDVTAEIPRKDGGELLLSKLFLDACSSVYAVFPGGQENQGQPFVSKHFNVIDPLRVNNNLGRSVSKGNFYRIRSAFALGAKKLARLLDCSNESILLELNHFFMNTWERHGNGNRPDAPEVDTSSRSSTQDGMSGTSDVSATSRGENQKRHANLNSKRTSDQIIRQINSNQATSTDKGQKKLQSQHLLNDIQGRFLFARTRSSPELTDTYSDVYSQGRQGEPDTAKTQENANVSSTHVNSYHRNKKNPEPDLVPSHSGQLVNDDPSSSRHATSRQSLDPAGGLNSGPNHYQPEPGLRNMTEDLSFAFRMQGMQKEQDIVNMMASSTINGFHGQVHMPLNVAAGHLPYPSVLASMGYGHRNFSGMVPTNFPLTDQPFSNIQFPYGFIPPHLSHYFSGIRLNKNIEDSNDPGNENTSTSEMKLGDDDNDYWQEQDTGSTGGFDPDIGKVEMLHTDDEPQSTSSANLISSSQSRGPGSSMRGQQIYSMEKHGSKQDHLDDFQFEKKETEVYSDERTTSSRFSSAAHSSSFRSKTSSDSSREEPSTKVTKSTREKRGNKMVAESSTVYGKTKIMSECASDQPEDDQDWNRQTNTRNEIERSLGMQSVPSLNMVRHHIPDYESAQKSGSEAMIPMSPMVFGSRQRTMDNSGTVPFAFYPTGPPVPFLTMLPVYNVPPDAGASADLTSHYGGEGLENSDPAQKFDSPEGLEHFQNPANVEPSRRAANFEASLEHNSDILNSDFASHWQNLQFGRFCQNPQSPGPLTYPSPVMVPPMYLQGRIPWDGPGRPLTGNVNGTPLMNYGPRLVPVSPIQPVSGRPHSVYQRYGDDLPRYRSGTGTYLPNPKVSARVRHSSGTRRGNYSYDRNENNGDREGNWNHNSKSRASGRNHNRNQTERSNSRIYRPAGSESQPDRSWNSYRRDTYPSYQSQNGPLHSNSPQIGLPNVTYGMYPVPSVNHNPLSSNGPNTPPLVMLYPYDHYPNYSLTAEQLDFGSLSQVGFPVMNEQYLSEGSKEKEAFDELRLHGRSAHHSSPDQPSSPHHYR